jgi:sugar phosphate isomerase/epimerase
MKLKLVRHFWGVDLSHGLACHERNWREAGYEALEVSIRLVPERDAFVRFLKESGFQWVPQVFSNDFIPGGSVRVHLDSLREQMEECLEHGPLFFNAHSGHDNWSPAEAEDFYGAALELEKEIGISISHETHRQRYFATPWQTREILQKFPALKLTCDFSHWVCVCERLLPDLGETIALAARQCHHVHARVGFEEGPQVPDPAAPEYAAHLAAHEAWWDMAWLSQKERGMVETTLTPEFGPPPYLHTLPYTHVPLANLTSVCDWMAARQAKRFLSL